MKLERRALLIIGLLLGLSGSAQAHMDSVSHGHFDVVIASAVLIVALSLSCFAALGRHQGGRQARRQGLPLGLRPSLHQRRHK